jgi:hypothetical protein
MKIEHYFFGSFIDIFDGRFGVVGILAYYARDRGFDLIENGSS